MILYSYPTPNSLSPAPSRPINKQCPPTCPPSTRPVAVSPPSAHSPLSPLPLTTPHNRDARAQKLILSYICLCNALVLDLVVLKAERYWSWGICIQAQNTHKTKHSTRNTPCVCNSCVVAWILSQRAFIISFAICLSKRETTSSSSSELLFIHFV